MPDLTTLTSVYWGLRGTISSGWYFRGTNFLSFQNVLHINPFINAMPRRVFTARSAAIPNQTRVRKLPRQRCRSIEPSGWRVFLVSVRSLRRSWRALRCFQPDGKRDGFMKFRPAPVSEASGWVQCYRRGSIGDKQFLGWFCCKGDFWFFIFELQSFNALRRRE